MGPDHRIAGVVAWFGAAPVLGVHGWPIVAGAFVAGAAAHGRLSPDVDQARWLCKIIPGGHRGVLHWWVMPILLYWCSTQVGVYRWAVLAIAIAWASHIITDGIFGRIPMVPRVKRRGWRYAGLGLKTGGKIEHLVAVPVFIILGVWALLSMLSIHPNLTG